MVINNTGSFVQSTNGDALGGFVLNGGSVTLAGTNGNLEDAFVAVPSALPSMISLITGASIGLARSPRARLALAMRVLVVEDETDLGEVFRDFLSELGHQPVLVRSAEAVTKIGAGTLTYAGTTANNTYTEPTIVNEGTLVLAQTTTAAFAGQLVVGAFSGSATVRVASGFNQTNNQPVIVNASGILDLSGGTASGQTIAALDVRGGTVKTNTNTTQTLTFNGAPTGGSFTLTFNGATTAAITYSQTGSTLASNIQTALNNLYGLMWGWGKNAYQS